MKTTTDSAEFLQIDIHQIYLSIAASDLWSYHQSIILSGDCLRIELLNVSA